MDAETRSRAGEGLTPEVTSLSDVEPTEVGWVWDNLIPRGKLTVMSGDPDMGKSTLTCEIAARVTRGESLPFSETPRDPESVLMLSAEDGVADTIRPRMDDAGADLERVGVFEGLRTTSGELVSWDASRSEHRDQFQQLLADSDPGLVVVDPLSAFLGSADSHKNSSVRGVLEPLARMAEAHDTALLFLRHLRKSGAANLIYMGLGSIGVTAAARSELFIGEDPTDTSQKVVLPLKTNLTDGAAPIGFRLGDDGVQFTGLSDLDPERALAGGNGKRPEFNKAVRWLHEAMQEGPRPAEEMLRAAEAEGIAQRTLRRAKDALGVVSDRDGETWEWRLEQDAAA